MRNGSLGNQFMWGTSNANDCANDFYVDETSGYVVVSGQSHWRNLNGMCGVWSVNSQVFMYNRSIISFDVYVNVTSP